MPVALGLQCSHPPSVSSHISPKRCPVLHGLGDRAESKNKGGFPCAPLPGPHLRWSGQAPSLVG